MKLPMVFFEGYTEGMKRVFFFNASIPSVNPLVIIFFITNEFIDEQKIIDERFTDKVFLSVILLVN
jgi:hypothetical protein